LGLGLAREFGVDVGLRGLYGVYFVLVLFFGFLWWMVPVGVVLWFEVGAVFAVGLFVPVVAVGGFVLFWIPRFCGSVRFVLEDDKVVVVKGVWWRSESFVPYNRITNVNVFQGPISRRFGLGKVSIQTAGFSATSGGGGKVAEAVIFGIKNFEEVKDVVLEFVRGRKPVTVKAETEV